MIDLPIESQISVEADLIYGQSFVTLEVDSTKAVITLAPSSSNEGMYTLAVTMTNDVSSFTYLRTVIIREPEREESTDQSESSEQNTLD